MPTLVEIITSVTEQLDSDPRKPVVAFSRNDSMKLLTLLTMLKNLIDKGEDKTPSQLAAIQAQRADAFERKCNQLTTALHRAMGLIDQLVNENGRLCAATKEPPAVELFAAKHAFDEAMKKLLEDQP